jgi:hypothetical protein
MRVCQFRHYGTVFYAPHWWPGHANRESLVLQRQRRLSIPAGMAAGVVWTARLLAKKTVYSCRKAIFSHMTEQNNLAYQAPAEIEKIPEYLSVEMRKIAHDLSNALEIIIQTSYLLSTVELKEPASDWLMMLDDGVQKAMNHNLALRNYIKEHTSN